MYRAHHAGIGIRPLVAHYADGFNRQQHRKALPNLPVQPRRFDLRHDDLVRLLQQRHALRRHLAQDAHGQPRPGKRLPLDDLGRHAQVAADAPDLILEQVAQRLDQLQLHIRRQPADVVMALDRLRWPLDARRLDHIRIQRALHQPRNFFARALFCLEDLLRLIVKHGDKLVADDFALGLRIGYARQLIEKARRSVDRQDVQPQLLAHGLLDFRKLVLAQHAIVHEDARQPVADSPRHQHRRN